MSASGMHHPPEFKHAADMDWEMGRFGNVTKFLFHPRPERPTEPNAGFLKYAPGASFPLHRHDFAQVWYIVEGEFSFAGKLYGPGTIAYMPDPTSSMKCTPRPAGRSSSCNIRVRPPARRRSMTAA
jgi:ChrR Cupin-like domain